MTNLAQIETFAIILLAVAALVAAICQRLRIPYTVALVLAGLGLTVLQSAFPVLLPVQAVSPDIILSLFIPPLIFEAAFHLEWDNLWQAMPQALTLAVPGVLLTAGIVGLIVHWFGGVGLGGALVFGTLISATDPVAVIALFKTFRVPRRLNVIVEAESLFNDGTAIVIFKIALLAAIGGAGSFSLIGGVGDFVRVAAGGVLVGALLGWLAARLIGRIDDHLVEITITACLAFGAYVIADQLQVSGVLAVLAAGVVCNQVGRGNMSPTTRIALFNFWEYIAFLANSLIFLLIGLGTNLSQLGLHAGSIMIAIAATLISRLVVVYGLSWLLGRLESRFVLVRAWEHVLFWSGLRGAISLALALSLPSDLPERETLRAMAFGVVLFTLLIQGTTMQFLIKQLRLVQSSAREQARDIRWGRLYASEAAWRRLRELRAEGLLPDDVWNELRGDYRQRRASLAADLRALYAEHGELSHELLQETQREMLRAERVALNEAMRRGLIGEATARDLIAAVDEQLDALTNAVTTGH
jgi:CPA1 family monovalent cation:H+ antiporter